MAKYVLQKSELQNILRLLMQEIYRPNSPDNKSSELSREQTEKFIYLMARAKFARAYPYQSDFFVRSAGMAKDGKIWTGGNKEYGLSDAFIHGETAVVSGLRDQTDSPIDIVAWYNERVKGPADFGRPCGNCRDVLKKYCEPETYFLNGNDSAISYLQLKDYLFEPKRYLNLDHVFIPAVKAAIDAARAGTSIYLPEKMKSNIYGAVLVSKDGTIWNGEHYSNVGYDAVPPVMGSVLHWKFDYPKGTISQKFLELSKLVVVSETGIPDVLYRDRQALLENDEIVRRFTKGMPIRVDLVHAKRTKSGSLTIYDAKRTNSEEWLPGPFTPGAFRMDDVMEAQLRQLIGQ